MNPLNESTIEHRAIALFRELGYAYAFCPDIGPDGDHQECKGYSKTLLLERLRIFIHKLISSEIRVTETDQLLKKTIG